jgi:hypothetical protein
MNSKAPEYTIVNVHGNRIVRPFHTLLKRVQRSDRGMDRLDG